MSSGPSQIILFVITSQIILSVNGNASLRELCEKKSNQFYEMIRVILVMTKKQTRICTCLMIIIVKFLVYLVMTWCHFINVLLKIFWDLLKIYGYGNADDIQTLFTNTSRRQYSESAADTVLSCWCLMGALCPCPT